MAGWPGRSRGDWIQIAIERDGELVGDVAVGLDTAGDIATIGYTLAPAYQGRGLGRGGGGRGRRRLFDALGVHRVEASLDPRNVASARVVEALGFEFEGVACEAVRDGDGWADDARYGLTAAGHAAWPARPLAARPTYARRDHPRDGPRRGWRCATHWTQERFVATVSGSYADALFPDVDGRRSRRAVAAGDRGRRRAGRLRDDGRGDRAPPGAVPVAAARRPSPPAPRDRRPRPGADRRAAARRGPHERCSSAGSPARARPSRSTCAAGSCRRSRGQHGEVRAARLRL